MTSYETLRVEHAPGTTPDEGVRCLVLNRPEVMNAMNTQMFVELRAALHDLAYDDGLRVLVVTGAGERAFSTGGDLKQRDAMAAAMRKTQIDSPRGKYTLAAAGNPIQDFYIREVKGRENVQTGIAVKVLADPARGCKM